MVPVSFFKIRRVKVDTGHPDLPPAPCPLPVTIGPQVDLFDIAITNEKTVHCGT